MILDQTDTTCECSACAYQWERGQSGEHDCLSRVIAQRTDLFMQLEAAEKKAAECEAAARFAVDLSETVKGDLRVTFGGDAQQALTFLMLTLWRANFEGKPLEEQNFLLMPFEVDLGEIDGGESTGREKFMLALQRAGGKTPGERWSETEAKRKMLHEVLSGVTDSLEILRDGREGFAPLLPEGSIPRGIVEGAFVGGAGEAPGGDALTALPFPARAPRVPTPPQVKQWRLESLREGAEKAQSLRWDAYRKGNKKREADARRIYHELVAEIKKLEKIL
jgi:hypothetical protein